MQKEKNEEIVIDELKYLDYEYIEICNKAKNEKPEYYRVTMYNGGNCIKCYKPSIMELLKKRTGLKYEEIKQTI